MSSMSTCLNFPRNTEEAFNFCKSVFGGDFVAPGIMRYSDIPPADCAAYLGNFTGKYGIQWMFNGTEK